MCWASVRVNGLSSGKAIEVEGEKDSVERCHEIIAEGELFG